GILSAVLTPLNKKLNADNAELINHINWLLKRGNDGIGLLGSTGEANSFSINERLQILEAVIDGGIPSNKLLVGTGCCAICVFRTILTPHSGQADPLLLV
ncbi:MAG: dihydrodipicolinate synthase family protein, partial [bacterium]|nr:dihydrodipicolinate synthase family protein [bacterium]